MYKYRIYIYILYKDRIRSKNVYIKTYYYLK
jgi:hypothetical protein